MKTIIQHVLLKSLLFLFIWTTFISCSKEVEEIDRRKDDAQLKKEVTKLELKGDVGVAQLITNTTSVEETSDGYKISGSIGAKLDGQDPFNIADGDFEFTVDDMGEIVKIVGTGMPDFPRVGVFARIRETFDFEKIKSHLEYETGKFYKDNYDTEIPLNDSRYYFHFQVFDQENGTRYELKNALNSIIYGFVDFYLDVNDPAVFFKTQLWKPGSGSDDVAESISKKLINGIKKISVDAYEYADATGAIIGISNQATILAEPYEFSKPEVFESLYGYSGFDSIPSHCFIRLGGLPIPGTGILTVTGDMYVHGVIDQFAPSPSEIIMEREDAFINWFNEVEIGSGAQSINGSIDFGGKGIGLVLGALPYVNEVLGYDVFNNDFNIDLLGVTYQEQKPGIAITDPSFLRFGGEFRKPILAEILGPDISKYIPSQPLPTGFLYFNIEDELENWSLFIQSSADIIVPVIGKSEFTESHFLLNKDGILLEGKLDLPSYGIFNYENSFKGMIGPAGFDLESEYNRDISLPNGFTITSKEVKAMVSSDISKGLYFEGAVELPLLGIPDANILAIANTEKVSISGSFSQGIIDMGYGFELPSNNMTFSTSTDPDEGVSFSGELDIPHIGFVAVTGTYNNSEFEFSGEVNGTIDFNGVELPVVGGNLLVNSSGMTIDGIFTLPYGLKTAQMSGSITKEEIKLSGKMATGIIVGGTTFTFSNSYINASSITGVSLGGKINLKRFSTNVTGVIYPGGTFRLTGSYTYSTSILKTTIGVVVTQSAIKLSGTGTVYSPVWPYPTLYSGSLSFNPNWAAGTIQVCYSGICFNI